jgi:hypothetical protein
MTTTAFLLTGATSLLLLSGTARAFDFEAGPMDGIGAAKEKLEKCLKESWKQTAPTEVQQHKAEVYMAEAKVVKETRKPELDAAKHAYLAAWKAYPISRDEVIAKEAVLGAQLKMLKATYRDAGINILNLLSGDQRKVFDATFKQCLQHTEN